MTDLYTNNVIANQYVNDSTYSPAYTPSAPIISDRDRNRDGEQSDEPPPYVLNSFRY